MSGGQEFAHPTIAESNSQIRIKIKKSYKTYKKKNAVLLAIGEVFFLNSQHLASAVAALVANPVAPPTATGVGSVSTCGKKYSSR